MRWLVLSAVVVLGFVACALAGRFVLHGPVTARSLAISVSRTAGSAAGSIVDDCAPRRESGTWSCLVADSEGSGGATYRVRVRPGGSCWTATLQDRAAAETMPSDLGGCVHRWQWSLVDLL